MTKPNLDNALGVIREANNLARVLIQYHVKQGACIDIGGKIYSATNIFEGLIDSDTLLDAIREAVPDGVGAAITFKTETMTERGYILEDAAHILYQIKESDDDKNAG